MLTSLSYEGRAYLGMPYPCLPLNFSLEAKLEPRFLEFCLGNVYFLLKRPKRVETDNQKIMEVI